MSALVNMLLANIFVLILVVVLVSGGRALGAVFSLPAFALLAMILSAGRAGPIWLGMAVAEILLAAILRELVESPWVTPDPQWVESSGLRVPLIISLAMAVIAWSVRRAMERFNDQLSAAREQEAQARQRADASAARFAEFADIAADGFWETDAELRLTYFSPSFARTLGAESDKILGLTPEQALLGKPGTSDLSDYMQPLQRRESYVDQLLCSANAAGQPVWLSSRGRPVFDGVGEFLGYRGVVHDTTRQRASEQSLRDSEQRLRTITDNIPALISYIDSDRVFRFNNKTYEQWLSRPLSEITGRRLEDVYQPRTYALIEPFLNRAFAGELVSFELDQSTSRDRHVRATYVPHVDAGGAVVGIYGLIHDITKFKQIEAQLRLLSETDALTGVANRRRYEDLLGLALARCERHVQPMALLFLDLDHFKELNDSLGHEAGDKVLQEFARRLLYCMRQTNSVARLGGDEFVIVLEDLGTVADAVAVADKVLAAMHQPMEVFEHVCQLSTSIGIVFRPPGSFCEETLLRMADRALYAAKSAGRGCYAIAQPEMADFDLE